MTLLYLKHIYFNTPSYNSALSRKRVCLRKTCTKVTKVSFDKDIRYECLHETLQAAVLQHFLAFSSNIKHLHILTFFVFNDTIL